MYADDSILIYSSEDTEQMKESIERDLYTIDEWMYNNFMCFNADKTKFMVFTTRGQPLTQVQININNHNIEQVTHMKYLGLTIDHKLDFRKHVEATRNKISPYIFVLRRTRYTLNPKTKLMLYYAHVHSHLTYLSSIWGYSLAINLEMLQVVQNKAVRSLFWPEYKRGNISTQQLMDKYKILNVRQLKIMDSLLLIKKIQTNTIKNSINLPTFGQIHKYNTRQKNDFVLPKVRLNTLHNSLLVRGLATFNKLPQHIKKETDLERFKKQIKYFITNNPTFY